MTNTRVSTVTAYLVMICCISTASVSTTVMADLTGNSTLTSNYIFRGLDQSNRSPAVQGGFDWSHGSGLYTGVWASSVARGNEGSIEADAYLGYATEWQKYGVGLDFGFIHYRFPHISAENNEIYGVVSYKGFSASLWYELNENTEKMLVAGQWEEVPGESNANTFVYGRLAYEITVGPEIGISVALGQQTLDADFDRSGAELDDIVDWSFGVSKAFFGVDFGLMYTDTNLDTDEKTDFITLSLSKSL